MIALALAFDAVDPLGGPVRGEGDQAVAIVVMGAGDARIRVDVGEVASLNLADVGHGYLTGTARMAARREVAVRVIEGNSILFDALVPLADPTRDVIAFDVITEGGLTRAVRAPYAPMAGTDLVVDDRLPMLAHVAWGALVGAGIAGAVWMRQRA